MSHPNDVPSSTVALAIACAGAFALGLTIIPPGLPWGVGVVVWVALAAVFVSTEIVKPPDRRDPPDE